MQTVPSPRKERPGLTLTRSQALLAEAQRLVPGETMSLMKRPAAFAPGAFPVYLDSGDGAVVTDVDGNQYVDYVCGLGANMLGHNHPAVVAAIQRELPRGLSHSLPTPLELSVARSLVDLLPGAEMTRFFKTGADATSAVVRLARFVTGRERVVTVGYNGWHDHFMFDTPGVPAPLASLTTRMPLLTSEDEARLLTMVEEQGQGLACVLLSLPYNRVVSAAYLHSLRAACHARGMLFILDEVVTGFRLARGGAQEFYDLAADAVCLSKGLAAGMPLSAVAGPARTMSAMAELQVSTTFGGERLSLAACQAALEVYRSSDGIAEMGARGKQLRDGINAVAERRGVGLRISGYDPLPCFRFGADPEVHVKNMEAFVAAMARRGVLLRRDANFLSLVHTADQIEATIASADDALVELGATAR